MGDILTYLEEQGNIPFSQSKFNEVDNLILSEMSYVDFDDIVPGLDAEGFITVMDACKAFFTKHTEEELRSSKSLLKLTPFLLKAMAAGERFQNARLSNYVSQLEITLQKQFAALHIELSDGTVYVAFRGTDDNLLSWQEACNMSWGIIPAQLEAAAYLENTMRTSSKNFRVGGQSKGGNLAVYAAMKCSENVKSRMIEIFDNDGPGFHQSVLQSEEYREISNKITRIIPEFSVVGMLFEHEGTYEIVSSNAKGIMQHDSMTWNVSGNSFVYKENLAKQSCLLSLTINRWMNNLKIEKRKAVVQSLFDRLNEKGVKKVYELEEYGTISLFGKLKIAARLSKGMKFALILLAFSFVTIYGKDFLNPVLYIHSIQR
jgi:uncharacterized membrane protein